MTVLSVMIIIRIVLANAQVNVMLMLEVENQYSGYRGAPGSGFGYKLHKLFISFFETGRLLQNLDTISCLYFGYSFHHSTSQY